MGYTQEHDVGTVGPEAHVSARSISSSPKKVPRFRQLILPHKRSPGKSLGMDVVPVLISENRPVLGHPRWAWRARLVESDLMALRSSFERFSFGRFRCDTVQFSAPGLINPYWRPCFSMSFWLSLGLALHHRQPCSITAATRYDTEHGQRGPLLFAPEGAEVPFRNVLHSNTTLLWRAPRPDSIGEFT